MLKWHLDSFTEAEQSIDDLKTTSKVLKSLKVTEEKWKRGYMKGRNTKLPPPGYGCCPFCEHDYVDLPPVNVEIAQQK